METTILTIAEAARTLRCHPSTLRRQVVKGRIPGFRLRDGMGPWRLVKERLEGWIEQEQHKHETKTG